MLQVVQKFLCFRKNKGKSLSMSAKVNPTTTYPCEICDLRFANKSLYLYHTKTHCSSGRPSGSIPPERSTQEKPNTLTTAVKPPIAQVRENSTVKRASNMSISRKRDSDVTNASFARSSQLDISQRASVIQIYFKSNTPHSRMSKVLYEEAKLNEMVESLKTKVPRQRRETELKFVTTNRKGKTHITYGIAEEWIERYENFLNGKCRDLPGPIDNQPLKERLKNRNIAQQTYAVNELVWRFLQKLYGGGPEVVYKEKSGSFIVSDDDRFSTTNDTFARSIKSEVLDLSLRGSIMDLDRTMKFDTDNPFRPMRMPNPGFYCYINTCLQILLGIPEFVDYISQGKYKDLIKPEKARFWPAVAETVSAYSKGETYFSPDSVKTIALDNFNPNEQHDAHEFMNFIMSGLQDEVNLPQPQKQIEHRNGLAAWNHYKKYNISILDELFAGQLASQIECSKCHNISTTYDPFLDLSLPVVSESSVTLDKCLSAFLNGDETIDSYGCEKCKTNGKAVKRLRIDQFPKMLIVQLKRFQTYPKKQKIQNYVEFPTEKWEISGEPESQREPQTYSLKAVICHIGPIDSGHYVCFSKRCNDWFLCDDERISRVAPKDISTGEAYVLIYKKEE